MVISVGLLGFGASGTVIAVYREKILPEADRVIPAALFLSGIFSALVLFLSNNIFGMFDSFLLFIDSEQILLLVITYFIFFLPFFFGALAIGTIFIKYIDQIGKLYFYNLVGSGFGGITAIILMWNFLPNEIPVILSLISIGSGFLLLPKEKKNILAVIGIIGLVISNYFLLNPTELNVSEYKSISKTLNLPKGKVELIKSSPHGLLSVVSADAIRYAPGLSLKYQEDIKIEKVIFNNGDWCGPLNKKVKPNEEHFLNSTTQALPYQLSKPKNVLVLKSNTGVNISHALNHNVNEVIAVDPNAALVDLLKTTLARDSDSLFFDPRVTVMPIEPRAFLSGGTDKFDLIILPIVESFGGTSGLFAVQEEYLLTFESLAKMWERLSDDGMISLSTWLDYPVKSPLKILSTLVEMLEANSIKEKEMHIIAVRSWGIITFVLLKNKLTQDKIEKAKIFCNEQLFDILILKNELQIERNRFNILQDTSLFASVDSILFGNRENFYWSYSFKVKAPSDDKPYFSNFIKWSSIPILSKLYGERTLPFFEIGYIIVILTFIIILSASIILIVLPLFKLRRGRIFSLKTLLYFGGIGMSFMLIEIVLIHKFIFYFGNHIYSAAIIISSLLIFSGVGSYCSSYLRLTSKSLLYIILMLVGIILIYIITLDSLIELTLNFTYLQKFFFTLVLIAPIAFFMGIPFPTGMKFVSHSNELAVPWAWGINGCVSVVSTVLAVILSVEFGFTIVMMFAVSGYVIAAFSSFK